MNSENRKPSTTTASSRSSEFWCEQAHIRSLQAQSTNPYYDLLSAFPDITKPLCYKDIPKHNVMHHIETTGPRKNSNTCNKLEYVVLRRVVGPAPCTLLPRRAVKYDPATIIAI
ncbi:unnamed protein product [Colias eurytheme]|nr:unnamed protein product [Colias eurytheme]